MTDLHLRAYEKGDEYKSETGKYPHPRSVEAVIVRAKHWGISRFGSSRGLYAG